MASRLAFSRLTPQNTVLLVCDVQERFREIIWKFDGVIKSTKAMAEGCRALGVPAVATEQYPKALGNTVKELEAFDFPRFSKMDFSMATADVKAHLAALGPGRADNVVIVGLETHVCVLQTTMDMIEMGKNVLIVVDGVSSQRPTDRDVALRAMERAGAFLTTTESVLFALAKSANHPNFKQISQVAKTYGKDPSSLPSNSNL